MHIIWALAALPYIITNEVVSDVVNKILHIIEAERCAVYNNLDKLVQLENEKV